MKLLKTGSLLIVLLFGFSGMVNAVEYIDRDNNTTEGVIMHYCSTGVMSGFHKKSNLLLCNATATINQQGFNDYNTNRKGMHACPEGSIMSGIHVKNDILKCNIVSGKTLDAATEYVDSNGNRQGMHACPVDWVMTGVHVKNNQFLCTKLK